MDYQYLNGNVNRKKKGIKSQIWEIVFKKKNPTALIKNLTA